MSIEYMSAVWKDDYYGQTDKAKLLVALAIADTANTDGFAFPSVDFIAHKARCRPRGVQEICRQLEHDGKLEIQHGKGRNGTNLYRLLLKGVRLPHPSDNGNSVEGVRSAQGAVGAGCGRAALKRTQTVRNRKERINVELSQTTTSTAHPRIDYSVEATEIIQFLNETTGRTFRPQGKQLDRVKARLAEPGVTTEGIRLMILRQHRLWFGSRIHEYMRPETLFRPEKFASYYDLREAPIPTDQPSWKTDPNHKGY